MYAVILQERTVVGGEIFAVYLHCLYLKYHNYSVEKWVGLHIIQAMRMVQLVQDITLQLCTLLGPK